MMRRFFTFVVLALMAVNANAQTLIAEKDWTGGFVGDYPMWGHFVDGQEGSITSDPEGVAITVGTQTGELWQPQVTILNEGLTLEEDGYYKVVITAKFPSDGTLLVAMGNWDGFDQYTVDVVATGDFQEVEVLFEGYPYNVDGNGFVLFRCGDFLGTTIVKSVQVYSSDNGYNPTIIGKCGQNVNYIYDKSTHKLTISGTGAMADYSNHYQTPWSSYANEIQTIEIGSGVTSIGNVAFSGCSGLTSVTIPNSVTSIGTNVFRDCIGLTSVTIPNSVTSIGDYAFHSCTGLTSVTIPNSVTSIGNYAFNGCSGLTSVTIPNSVTSIGSSAFSGCSGLTSVNISDLAAWCIIKFSDYDSNPLYYAHHLYINGNEIKNLVIPNSVTSIGSYAFSGCSGLTSVTIPNNITSVGSSVFEGCSGLTSVTIPSSVTSIGNDAFKDCTGLTSVTIPNSVNSISRSAFRGCTGLSSVTIPNSVTSISTCTFYDCSGLTSVTIPNGVISIDDSAFSGCSGLISVTIPNSVTRIGSSAFQDCNRLNTILSLNSTPPSVYGTNNPYYYPFYSVDKKKCVVWVPRGCVAAYTNANPWKDFSNFKEIIDGDVNLDGEVNQADLDATVDFIMGKDPEGFYESLADLNGDDVVDAADVVKLLTILNLQEGLNMDYQAKYSNQVISSLSCTLNNDGDKAIQLTKCELYCNHSVVSSSKFKVTLAKGESKKCSFDELESLSSITGFSVVWYYTYNGEDYTYCCEIEE